MHIKMKLTYGTPKTYTSRKQYPKLYASQIGAGITSTSVTKPDIVKNNRSI